MSICRGGWQPARRRCGYSASTVSGASSGQLLSVSLAVVMRAGQVLLVCHRDNTEEVFWGWPTGVVKPGRDPALTVSACLQACPTGSPAASA
ncbi:MAG: hypothetical protein ACRDSF_09855 [Pseudonocardiaceae bacterium]